MESELTHLDLFSGIGGFALAAGWAGFRTIGFVEIDKYCQKVLRKHWPDVPIVEDIRNVEKIKEIVANAQNREQSQFTASDTGFQGQRKTQKRPIIGTSRRGGDGRIAERIGRRERTATTIQNSTIKSPALLVTAGFPCQPFSVAGKRQGERDDRYLWPETIAVIKAVKPSWVLLENVTGIIKLALDTVLSDLEGAGYSYETLIVPACAVNAWHRRDRVWIIANYEGSRFRPQFNKITGKLLSENRSSQKPKSRSGYVPDPQREGLEGADTARDSCPTGQSMQFTTYTKKPESGGIQLRELSPHTSSDCNQPRQPDWWAVEPELGRVAHGIPNRVDRLKCLGNAIVPQVAYQILKRIAEIEHR